MVKKVGLRFNPHITLKDVEDMCNAMKSANKEKYRNSLGNQFHWGLQFSDTFKGIFENLIDQQFEVAVGIILFQVFDN